jgi:FtsP/CotA-like multicopper oxidase with cupredoxin domain
MGYKTLDEKGQLVRRTYSESSVRKINYNIKTVLQWHSKFNDYQFDSKPFDNNKPPKLGANQGTEFWKRASLKSC